MAAVALVFHGPTNYPATKILRNVLCNFGNGQPVQSGALYDTIYLMLSSEGGSIEEAFSLYNLLRVLPAKLITINMGQIASAGNILFLAGEERFCCEHSYFHFHNLSWFYDKPVNLHRIQMQDHVQIVDMERELYLRIFKERTKFTDTEIEAIKFLEHPMVKDASFALEHGIIQKIGMPDLPAGTPIFNVDY
ncbi:ATP-dependent Clp protease proteolytic subunit [Bradyrhizobium sp. CW1]|uniref:ATP-dependent Clp protease proteolytic subunit n=1 Tax=Bradyrhizobium sp. CW1 TaxID=2782686 RepID=UPI001FFF6EA8|nr:ATP-dependent Clp protease proteolytic subunit [Bradyrhizobium sp. CW1]UPJ30299.1 ATP-dependent Clp protease proteolytic subunit [Bradyrhizobium sp. CW1]